MTALPDFTIPRLGPATVLSPLAVKYGEESAYFVGDDERTLFDTAGRGELATEMLKEIDAVSLEIAGPRRHIYFEPKDTRAAIVACGGLCPGINHVIRGLVRELTLQYGVKEVLGIRYGFQGLVAGGAEPLVLTPQNVDRIHEQGGNALGSSRGPQQTDAMAEFIRRRDIQILFTIGGDGTSRGSLALSKALRTTPPTPPSQGGEERRVSLISLPKTIDNDLNFVDKSFGFETAFTVADQALRAAHAEALGAFNGVGLVKLMGRHSGYITTLAALANGDVNFVLIPEVHFELEGPNGFLSLLERRLARKQHAVVAVAEGAGQDLLQEEVQRLGVDASGNRRLADIGVYLKATIEKHFKTRGIPVNVRYIDPSYMIRSSPATPNDAVFCLQLAQHAVHAAMSGRTEMVVGIWKNTFTHVPLAAVILGSRRLDPHGPLWLSLLQSIEQPARMGK